MSSSRKGFCWIETVAEQDATGLLKEIYDGIARNDGSVHNLYKAFSLWPEPLPHADRLYTTLLHSGDTFLEDWCLELVATYVAILARCKYARTHHGANFVSLLGDDERAAAMLEALENGEVEEDVFDTRLLALLDYTRKLTREPESMNEADLEPLRAAGIEDRGILEVNQVCANFNYWVRTINGLGIVLGDEKVGKY